jgi:hypothetical protein
LAAGQQGQGCLFQALDRVSLSMGAHTMTRQHKDRLYLVIRFRIRFRINVRLSGLLSFWG